jgi:hypothetical protein
MHKSQYIEIHVSNHQILHGFDDNNKEIIEEVMVDKPMKKLIRKDRIQSVSEKYILTSYAFNRLVYWEYEESYDTVKEMLGSISAESNNYSNIGFKSAST